jgi:serine/threonine protein phosphatase PrpC
MTRSALHLESAALTHPGHRRQVNEDAVLCLASAGLWAVADGLGGYPGGERASALLVQALSSEPLPDALEAATEVVRQIVARVNQRLCSEITMQFNQPMLGTTVVIIIIRDARCVCLWAGDSRLYVMRAGTLYQVTRDHSLVQQLIESGELSEETASDHPQGHIITRALGMDAKMELEVLGFDLSPGDQLLLCSDGLYNELDATSLVALLSRSTTTTDWSCERMVHSLLQSALDTQARDNIAINLVQVSELPHAG